MFSWFVDLKPMLEQSISDLLKKRNLGWNLNSEGLGLELVDLRSPSRGSTLLLVRIICRNVCADVASAVEWGRHMPSPKGVAQTFFFDTSRLNSESQRF